MPPVYIRLDSHYKDDTWTGMTVGPVLINTAQPEYTLASVKMQFRDQADQLGHEFNTVGGTGIGTITITNATTWVITVPEQLLNLTKGIWSWDFETINSEGTKLTLYEGIIKVIEDTTS